MREHFWLYLFILIVIIFFSGYYVYTIIRKKNIKERINNVVNV